MGSAFGAGRASLFEMRLRGREAEAGKGSKEESRCGTHNEVELLGLP